MTKFFGVLAATLLLGVPAEAAFQIGDDAACVAYSVAIANQTEFEFPWPVIDGQDLRVFSATSSAAEPTELSLVTDFTVTGTQQSSGGTVTLDDGADVGNVVTICRQMLSQRQVDFSAGGSFKASSVELELNNLEMQLQDLDRRLERALSLPPWLLSGDFSEAVPDPREAEGKYLGVALGSAAMSWLDPDCDGVCDPTVSETVFKVEAYGAAACDGVTNTGPMAQAAVDAACAAGGGVVEFPAGVTCVMTQTVDTTAPLTISCDNITLRGNGATLKGATSDASDSWAENRYFGAVIRAVGADNLTVEGFAYDGARSGDGSAGPRLAFLIAIQSNNLLVRDNKIQNVNGAAGGILVTSFKCVTSGTACTAVGAGSTNVCMTDVRIEDNYFAYSTSAVNTEDSIQNLWIENNTVEMMDLADYAEDMASGYGDHCTANPCAGTGIIDVRGIRLNGHLNSGGTPVCDAQNHNVSGNNLSHARFAIEDWNQGTTYGNDVSTAHNVTIQGNTIVDSTGCVWVNGWRGANISNNNCTLLTMSAVERAAYQAAGGYIWGRLATSDTLTCSATSGPMFKAGIEARPLEASTVEGNTVDCKGTITTDENHFGIVIGADFLANDTHVVGNTVTGCGYGIKVNETGNAVIAHNDLLNNFGGIRVDANETGGGTATYRNNAVVGNTIISHPDAEAGGAHGNVSIAAPSPAILQCIGAEATDEGDACTTDADCDSGVCGSQEWTIKGNFLKFHAAISGTSSSIDCHDTGAVLDVSGNTVLGFDAWGVFLAAKVVTASDNYFDSLNATPATQTSPWRIDVQDAQTVVINNTVARNVNAFLGFHNTGSPAGFTSTYNFGTFYGDSDLATSNMVRAGYWGDSAVMPTNISDVEVVVDGQATVHRGTVRRSGSYVGSGTPEGAVDAERGSVFGRTDGGIGTSLYGKTSDATTADWHPVWMPRPTATVAADATQPSGYPVNEIVTAANTVPTAITQITNVAIPHEVTIRCGSSTNASTITDGGNFKLSANWTPDVDDTITLYTPNGTTWYERGRSSN